MLIHIYLLQFIVWQVVFVHLDLQNTGWIPALWLFMHSLIFPLIWFNRSELKAAPTAVLIIGLTLSLLSPTYFENDHYRYFYDGYQFINGHCVYCISPIEGPRDGISSEIINKIGFQDVRTAYPPMIVAFFGLVVHVANSDFSTFVAMLRGLSAIILLCSTFLVLKKTSKQSSNKSLAKQALLAMSHPLLFLELIVNLHFDFLIYGMAALFLVYLRNHFLVFVIYSASIKTFSLIALFSQTTKSIWAKSKIFYANALVALAVALFLLFSIPIEDLQHFKSNWSFASLNWEMNSGVFRWVRLALNSFVESPEFLLRLSQALSLLLYVFIVVAIRKKSLQLRMSRTEYLFLVLFLLPLFLPVANPWYFTWALPLLFVAKKSTRSLYFFCALCPLSFYYLFFLLDEGVSTPPGPWLDIEHLLIFIFLLLGICSKQTRKGFSLASLAKSFH